MNPCRWFAHERHILCTLAVSDGLRAFRSRLSTAIEVRRLARAAPFARASPHDLSAPAGRDGVCVHAAPGPVAHISCAAPSYRTTRPPHLASGITPEPPCTSSPPPGIRRHESSMDLRRAPHRRTVKPETCGAGCRWLRGRCGAWNPTSNRRSGRFVGKNRPTGPASDLLKATAHPSPHVRTASPGWSPPSVLGPNPFARPCPICAPPLPRTLARAGPGPAGR
jgi:hypothetical protein